MSEALLSLQLPWVPRFSSGKVREVFDLGKELVIVATDRISAFDCVLPTGIPDKGRCSRPFPFFGSGSWRI